MTYCASFCISRLCPLLYITACEPGINHFPASLLHEMKEFIMVTVSRCKAFTVIYLGKMIDSLTQREQCFTMVAAQLPFTPCCCAHAGNMSPVWKFQLGVPCSSIQGLQSHQFSSLPGWFSQQPGGGRWHSVAKKRALLIRSYICLPTCRMSYSMTSRSDLLISLLLIVRLIQDLHCVIYDHYGGPMQDKLKLGSDHCVWLIFHVSFTLLCSCFHLKSP